MQASLNWLKDYVDIKDTPEVLAEKLTMAGVPVERIEYLGTGIKNVVTGKIVEINHHPDADKLWICKVDVGTEVLTIVTGAQNVRQGHIVPVALVGAELPSGLKIKKAKLRGIESAGMLCSSTELNLDPKTLAPSEREGILILSSEVSIGQDIKSVLGLDDVILEFELTPNRADCFSMLGLAREIAVLTGAAVKKPILNVKETGTDKVQNLVKVTIEEPLLCSRFCTRVLKNVKVQASPFWMQKRLRAAGMRPINNVVDVTNFVMLEMGQPMHAYDYDLVGRHHLVVRRAKENEPLTTLDGVKRTLNEEMLIISDESQAVGIAGVMGGLATEVTQNTTSVILEAASFNSASVRRTSRALGLRSEASGRFERGVDTANSIRALDRAAQLLESMGACSVCPGIVDSYSQVMLPKQISFTVKEINEYLGTQIAGETMVNILQKLEFGIEKFGEKILATVPTWRSDVTCVADISEEIARINGYDNIPSTVPIGPMLQGGQSDIDNIINEVRDILIGIGYNEAICFSFMNLRQLDKIRISEDDSLRKAVSILNPITDDFSHMRTTLIPGILETIVRNIARKNDDVKIFEAGKVYLPKSLPIQDFVTEKYKLVGAVTGKESEVSWNMTLGEVDFYSAKGVVEAVLRKMGIENYIFVRAEYPYLHPGKCAKVKIGDDILGFVGELHPEVQSKFELSKKVYLFELDLDLINKHAVLIPRYKQLPKYPAITRDLALIMPLEVSASELVANVKASAGKYLETVKIFDIYTGEQVAKGCKSVALSLMFRNPEKTLTDEEVDNDVNNTVEYLDKTLAAKLRS